MLRNTFSACRRHPADTSFTNNQINGRSIPIRRLRNRSTGEEKTWEKMAIVLLTVNGNISWRNASEYGSQALATTLHSSTPITALVRSNSSSSGETLLPSRATQAQLNYSRKARSQGPRMVPVLNLIRMKHKIKNVWGNDHRWYESVLRNRVATCMLKEVRHCRRSSEE